MAITGHVTLNGLDDGALIIVIEAKRSYPAFAFDPTKMRTEIVTKDPETTVVPKQRYTDVTLTWSNTDGLRAVESLLGELCQHAPDQPAW